MQRLSALEGYFFHTFNICVQFCTSQTRLLFFIWMMCEVVFFPYYYFLYLRLSKQNDGLSHFATKKNERIQLAEKCFNVTFIPSTTARKHSWIHCFPIRLSLVQWARMTAGPMSIPARCWKDGSSTRRWFNSNEETCSPGQADDYLSFLSHLQSIDTLQAGHSSARKPPSWLRKNKRRII